MSTLSNPRLNRVYDFLLGLYGREGLSAAGLKAQTRGGGDARPHHETHDLVAVGQGGHLVYYVVLPTS